MERQEKFFAINDVEEELSATSPDEAICDYLEQIAESDIPESVTMNVYSPMTISWPNVYPLEHVIEALDEEYGSPHESTIITNKMEEIERRYKEELIKRYRELYGNDDETVDSKKTD